MARMLNLFKFNFICSKKIISKTYIRTQYLVFFMVRKCFVAFNILVFFVYAGRLVNLFIESYRFLLECQI